MSTMRSACDEFCGENRGWKAWAFAWFAAWLLTAGCLSTALVHERKRATVGGGHQNVRG